MRVISHTDIEVLANEFLKAVMDKENFDTGAKGSFLTGGKVLVCESKGLQEYLKKICVDKYEIWTALSFKPLAGLLMQCAYNLSPKDKRADEKNNVYNPNNLVWAIYDLLPEKEKTFSCASEIASLFFGYQIYRPKLINDWTDGKVYEIQGATGNFIKNEERQRKLFGELTAKYGSENITRLYGFIESALKNPSIKKDFLPRQIFIFAPPAMAPIHLKTLTLLAASGCKVNLYVHQVSKEYIGEHLSDKQIARNRKNAWANNKIVANENKLYWDLGNRLIANLGRSAQVFYEQILEYSESVREIEVNEPESINLEPERTLLKQIQEDIINDNDKPAQHPITSLQSVTFNNCFSPLREIEVLSDYILDLFANNKELTPADIAVVAPNIDIYASAIEMVFERYEIPYKIADCNVKKYDKTTQLLNMLFSLIGSRYEAPDVVALFEYSRFAQNMELDFNSRERLEKWVRENAIRHGLKKNGELPDYSFESGFDQLAAGFFMISESGFSDAKEYCYPDIEGNSAYIFGDFVLFVRALEELEEKSKAKHTLKNWDIFLKENLQIFFDKREMGFNEDGDNPYQKVMDAWNSLRNEMKTGFGNENASVNFSVLKSALLAKIESYAKKAYSASGNISFSNIETIRAVPHEIICCIGMNSKEFPSQTLAKDISLIAAKPEQGDKDEANEDRLMFLETILSARKSLYISWVGQSEKNADELDPSSVVVMLLNNLKNQYGIDKEKIVVKHPLQPFSRKYFEENSDLSSYDNRWEKDIGDLKNIWEWRVKLPKDNEKNFNELYKILSDVPKYFLKNVLKVELPEDIELLGKLEPFVIESNLDRWQLMQWILDGESGEKIKIEKLRGKLPNGKFADKIISKTVKEAEELRERAKGESVKYLISASNDKGKYRLRHWLYHLILNLAKEQDTKIFLRNKTITLSGMAKVKAENILNELWELKQKLENQMLPIFPDAAYDYCDTYCKSKKKTEDEKINEAIKKAEANIFGFYSKPGIVGYSTYARKILGKINSFEDFEVEVNGIKEKFKECSEKLFENYKAYLQKEEVHEHTAA